MQDQDRSQTRESLIKLNPSTITIPPSSKASPGLKLALTPHLTIQDPTLPTRREGIKKDGDAVFEVIIPVGGVIGVCVEISRDGLERVGGADMSLTEEMELEEVVKKKVLGTFVDVSYSFLSKLRVESRTSGTTGGHARFDRFFIHPPTIKCQCRKISFGQRDHTVLSTDCVSYQI
jgi:hypothetical protein